MLGATFISSSQYAPKNHNTFYDLEICRGDKVKITSYHSGEAYVGFNMTTKRSGMLKANFYLKDVEDTELINKTAMRSGPRCNDDDDPPISHIGKTFIATDTQSPKHPKDVTTLNIRIGDKIEIINYATGNTFAGFNKTSKEKGQFNMDIFRKDVERSSLDFMIGPSTSKKTPQSSKHVYVGKTFIASHDYFPRKDAADDLPIRYGDAIEIVKHDFGDIFEGYNTRTDRMGLVDISYFKRDINSAKKTGESFSAKGSRRPKNYSYNIGIPQTDGNDDSYHYPQVNPATYVGKTFISSHSWTPNNGSDLAISLGDAIEIINDDFEGNYEGYNTRTKSYGRFQARFFQKDIDAFDYVGKRFTATRSLYNPDLGGLQINTGDVIEITNVIGRDLYTGNNLSTRKMGGELHIEQFREDVKRGHYAGIDDNREYKEHRHFADETADDGSAHEPQDKASLHRYIDKVFTATSSQNPRGLSDITLLISTGDMIAIEKFVSGSTFRCFNVTTGETGHVKLDNYWKDIETVERSRDCMDVDSPATRISTSGRLETGIYHQQWQQERLDKTKFEIQGASRNSSRARESL